MDTKRIYLSIYSLGFGAGFLRGAPQRSMSENLEQLVRLVRELNLGGVEIPIDRCFPQKGFKGLEDFHCQLVRAGLGLTCDLETFSREIAHEAIEVLSELGLTRLRIKMSNIYGGARYLSNDFEVMKREFLKDLLELAVLARRNNVQFLIENHQDLCADELLEICNTVGSDVVGVNWDIGSSLALGDTPDSFLQKVAHLIGNVHLKDYWLFRNPKGVSLVRCPLGEGCVDLGRQVSALFELNASLPMSIELGAHAGREVDLYEQSYWDAFPDWSVSSRAQFFAFVTQHTKLPSSENDGKTPWELGASADTIEDYEIRELRQSVRFLEGIRLESVHVS